MSIFKLEKLNNFELPNKIIKKANDTTPNTAKWNEFHAERMNNISDPRPKANLALTLLTGKNSLKLQKES